MKLLKLLLLFVIQFSSSYPQWNQHNYQLANADYQNIFFKENRGWIVGTNGLILFSSDRGENWQQQISNTSTKLNSVYFFNENYGWIVGDNGTYLRTTNGGSSWIKQVIGYNNNFYRIQFVDTTTGFISGKDIVLKTTNGGNIWSPLISKSDYFYGMFWVNENVGFIGADTIISQARTVVQKTTNSGLSWNLSSLNEFPYFTLIFEIKFKQNIGFALGEDFLVWRTTNLGNTWQLLTQPFSSNYYSIDFTSDKNIWIAGRNSLQYSSNSGGTWKEQHPINNLGYQYFIRSIHFWDSLNGIAVGRAISAITWGLILKTNNGGGTTSIVNDDLNPIDYFLVSAYPNPFNSSTNINLRLSQNEIVNLEIFNFLGQKIETIFYGYLDKGNHNFNFQSNNIGSGIYLLRCSTNKKQILQKLVLLK